MNWIEDFLSLIFPRTCLCCGNSLWKNENTICHFCNHHLPRTHFHLDNENPLCEVFRGRVAIEHATAFLSFNKGGKVQHLIHQLKYKGRGDVGVYLGTLYGRQLSSVPFFQSIQMIVPVPLHKTKYKQRGYNQSERFASGLASSMHLPVNCHSLLRIKTTETQTKKSRFDRYRNVREVFTIKDPAPLLGKHLLLVDDVITTGATVESCIQALQVVPGCKVSVACIAFTKV